MTLNVRPIAATDEPEWRRLWTAYLTFYETTVPEDVYRTTFARLLSGGEHEYRGFLAVLDGKPVGLAHYLFHRHCWTVNDTCYLQDLYADPEVRGQGIGRALIEAVHAEATRAGSQYVYWTTAHDNTTARKLYDRIGELTPFIEYNKRV
ncbi:ribosomal protein S18 acetylase RimI-like enzyme [Phyllobacterium myrsinacearum]|uniref:GNAT family N-acetyltransferase n=1 Tax=Phyllobacterium myrsinacearum TaxID=28101 RepID=UPI001029910D|nr:GNAT family N-acetyltransferase [Phyllobacterium myrsinacearum]RZS82142.1 ribosomal protein S18 acetylase RimI-like enzyme [Phyllobacterium myrsinacearum]